MGEPEHVGMLAEHPNALRVERTDDGFGDGGLAAFSLFVFVPQQLADAVLHLACGFVGERHRKNAVRCRAVLDEVGDAEGDHAGLACSRAS